MKHKNYTRALNPVDIVTFFFKEERRSGVILILAAITALLLANSQWSDAYFNFIGAQYSLGSITFDVQHWVSEGLMAIFFLVVVLEIKRELIDGELNTWKKASFPVIAAVGGMIVPALIYTVLNSNLPQSNGWAIPIATDIAIAVGVLALLGNKIPKNLRIFLLALAIIDDIGSILIIATFYSQPNNALALIGVIAISMALFAFRNQPSWLISFTVLGLLLWYLLLLTGISGTMAGVIVAAIAPLTTRKSNNKRLQLSEKIEDILIPIAAYFIVPLFVFTSVGLSFSHLSLTTGNGSTVFIGVVLGLFIGKPLGVFSAAWLGAKLHLTQKPNNLNWSHILGVGMIAGVGFTISLLIADLSFNGQELLHNAAIFGVLIASILSALLGLIFLASTSKKQES